MTPDFGALILSLDFELHWGIRDVMPTDGAYRRNLLGVQQAVPAILEVFREFELAATWATVGLLFARDQAEAKMFTPRVRPRYVDSRLDPYQERVGPDEAHDPLHYAPTLIEAVRRTPRQEIATHTFSHYYCLAPGQTPEAFNADLASAVAIARARDIPVTSIVFPRNEHNPAYDRLLRENGITCYRGNPSSWLDRPLGGGLLRPVQRATRMARDYLVGPRGSYPWSDIPVANGLANVRASAFLRPASSSEPLDRLRMRATERLLGRAAAARRVVHLWWHPHNFGARLPQNIAMLRRIAEAFARLRERHGFQSLSMRDAARVAMSG